MATNAENQEPIISGDNQIARDKKVRSIMMWCSIACAVIVIGAIAYIFGYRQPQIEAGNDAIGQADLEALFGSNDSIALAQYEAVANSYGFDAGNRAALAAAELLYKKGEYAKALEYLNKFSPSDEVIGSLALALKGDCLVNLDKNEEALNAFTKALRHADNNPQLTPYLLNKQGVVMMALGKYADAAEVYDRIETEYPNFAYQCNAEARRTRCEAELNNK